MNSNLARTGPSGLAVPHTNNDDIKIFDTQSGEFRESGARVDVIATISLGYKSDKGFPVATQESHERWLHAHDADDAPALLEALRAGNHRRLTISLASDVWGEFCQQHPAAYTKTKLKIYGDDTVLYYIGTRKVIDPRTGETALNDKNEPLYEPVHLAFRKDEKPEEYASLLKETKNQVSIYFYLAEWTEMPDGSWLPQVVMDGDTGLYRLRTTSAHTVENLASTVKQIRAQTGGFIKGVPLTLSVGFPEVSGPDGSKRKVPVCTFRLQPPYKITGVNFAPMLAAAVNEGQMLALPVPRETMEDEERTEPVAAEAFTEREREIDLIARGGRCPVGRYTRIFFSMTRGTDLEGDEARARLVSDYSKRATDSLSCLLNWSTDEEAQKFIAHVDELLNGPDDPKPESAMRSDEYERTYGAAYRDEPAPLTTPPPSIRQRQQPQPDGSVVDTTTGEIVHEPPAATDQEPEPQVIDAESREVPTSEVDVEEEPIAPADERIVERTSNGLCTHPECVEANTQNKAAEDTYPLRCLNHIDLPF